MSVQAQTQTATGRRIVVIGGGGHAKVTIATLQALGLTPEAILDADSARHGTRVLSVPVVGGDEKATDFPPATFALALGIGGVDARRRAFAAFTAQGYRFVTLMHPSAVVATDADIGTGAQVMAGAVVQPAVRIGKGALINTRASIDHDCLIGDHVHIGPGAVLCGDVQIGDGTLIGAGAVVRPGTRIGADVIVGLGAAVIANVAANTRVAGVPAHPLASLQAQPS